jgi:hypothetical protein
VTLNLTYVGDLITREFPGVNIDASQRLGNYVAGEPFNLLNGISTGIASAISWEPDAEMAFMPRRSTGSHTTTSRELITHTPSRSSISAIRSTVRPRCWLQPCLAGVSIVRWRFLTGLRSELNNVGVVSGQQGESGEYL